MSRKFLTAIDLGKNELQNAAVQNLASAPGSPVKGQLYYNSTGGDDTLYWWNGSAWIAAKSSAGISPASTVTDLSPGGAQVVGVSTLYARQDHIHGGIPAAGAITATTVFGQASANGAAVTYARSDHTHGSPVHDNTAHAAINHSALAAPTTDVAWGGFKLTNLGTPTAVGDASTKGYVDNAIAGLSWKETCRAATVANMNLATTGLTAFDGVTPAANDRILVMNQTTQSENGLYLAAVGAWTRTTDGDAVGELEGAAVFVTEGTANGDKSFTCTTNGPIIPGTTANVWAQFGGGSAVIGGTGLTVSGSTVNFIAANGSLTVAADDVQVAYAGTGTTFGSAVTAARSDHNHDTTYPKLAVVDCAAALTTTLTHNFNTRDVEVDVYRTTTPWDSVDVDVERDTLNSVLVRFGTAPAAAAFRIVAVGRA